jgi:hypothetical protein
VPKRTTAESAPTTLVGWRLLIHRLVHFPIYLFASAASSTIAMQYPWGLTVAAFFRMVIFIVVS